MATSVKSSLHIDYKKCYSYPFDLKIKHLNSFILNDSNRVFLHTCERILIGSKICILKAKLIHALLIRKSTKPCYIRFTACIVLYRMFRITITELTNDITCRSLLSEEYLFILCYSQYQMFYQKRQG